MSSMSTIEPYEENSGAAADYCRQARVFLAKGREYLADDDLHQASEKGWGAAAWMAKAIAEAQGWQYNKHDEFFTVMYQAEDLSGDNRLRNLWQAANTLHGFFYTRKIFCAPTLSAKGLTKWSFCWPSWNRWQRWGHRLRTNSHRRGRGPLTSPACTPALDSHLYRALIHRAPRRPFRAG